MPEDRGGLKYSINVDGNFDAKIDAAIAKLATLEKSFDKLGKGITGGGAGRVTGGSKQQLRDLDVVERKLKAIENQMKVMSDRRVVGSTKDLKAQRQIFNEQTKANALALTQEQANATASNNRVRAENKLLIKKAEILQVQKAQNISQRKAADIVGVTSSQAKQLGLNMWDAEHAARQFLFTFRRLVGILAVFTLARQFAQALGAGVKEMVNFNKELETAKTGIATIISSVGQIRDENGELLKGAEAYNVALKVSGNLVNTLRKEAVGSIATFEELTRGFQEAVGPGLAAGLDTKQIVEVSKSLVEGAKTLNIPLNQLGEEIRSLLKGTATARNTRLAVLFGGAKEANEAIRTAAEQGRLYEVLREKLDAVGQGALEASDNFAVLNSDLQDSVSILLAQGGVSLFDELKTAIRGVREALVETNGGETVVAPGALAIVQQVSDGLAGIIKNVREFADAGQFGALFYQALVDINAALSVLAPLALSVFSGILTGVNAVLAPVTVLAKIIGEVSDYLSGSALGKGLLAVGKYTTAIVTGMILWRKILLQINAIMVAKGFVDGFKTIHTAIGVAVLNLQALNGNLTFSNILSAVLNKQLDAVVLKTTLASAGIALLVGALVYAVARMTVLSRKTKDTANEADILGDTISSAVDSQREGVKTAKEWTDQIKDLQRELAKAKGIKGLKGTAKELGTIFRDVVNELDKGTEYYRTQLSTLDAQESSLKSQSKLLKAQVGTLKLRNEIIRATAASFGTLDDLQMELPNVTPQEMELFRMLSTPSGFSSLAGASPDFGQTSSNALKALEDQSANIEGRRSVLEKKKLEAQKQYLEALDLQVKIFNEENPLRLASLQTSLDTAEAEQTANKFLSERANISVKNLANAAAEASVLDARVKLAKEERKLALETAAANVQDAKDLKASKDTINGLERELNKLKKENSDQSRVELANMKAQSEELERQQKLLAGGFGDALSVGLEDFVNELPSLGEQIAEVITGSLTDLSGVVADVFKDAIDPRTDPDIKTAFGEFFLDLAGQFVEAMAQQAISNLLVGFGVGGGEEAQQAAQTAAVSQNTAALTALNATISRQEFSQASGGAAFTGPLTQSGGTSGDTAPADTAKSQGIGATIGAAMQANPLLSGILIPILIGLLASAFKKGGEVKGYATGGSVGDFGRPSSIPASDTVPAWLTPGEFVIKKDMVKKYGTGMLTSLNNGLLNPGSFAPAAFALGGMAKGIRGYATGGSVQRTVGSSKQSTQGAVRPLPVMVTSEKNANQIFTGGRRALTNNVNKVPIVGDSNAKGMG